MEGCHFILFFREGMDRVQTSYISHIRYYSRGNMEQNSTDKGCLKTLYCLLHQAYFAQTKATELPISAENAEPLPRRSRCAAREYGMRKAPRRWEVKSRADEREGCLYKSTGKRKFDTKKQRGAKSRTSRRESLSHSPSPNKTRDLPFRTPSVI